MDVSEAIAWSYNNQGSISHNGSSGMDNYVSSPLRVKPILNTPPRPPTLNVQGSGNHEAETNTSYSQILGEYQSVPGQFWQEILERLDRDMITMDSHDNISQQLLLVNDHGSVNVQRKKCQKVANKITALQKIVSPYGKTDTASVLQEASIFIKVLLKQIQILTGQEKNQKKQVDLQTKGLCLVPVSFIKEFIEEESESAVLDRFMQLNNLSIQAFRNS